MSRAFSPNLLDGGGAGGGNIGISFPGPGGGGGSGGGGVPPILVRAGQNQAGATASTGSTSNASLISWPSINWGRIGAFLLGLILIAAGLYLLKPIQQFVKTTVKTAGKAAAHAAAAGDE
jgi:hypothetical protein